MTAYIGILEKEPGTLWGVWFPDLPGCIAAAETSEETLAQAGEALGQWLAIAEQDGQVMPSPRTIEDLRPDTEFSAALAAGHVAVFIRSPADDLGLDNDQLRAVDQAAERRGLSVRGLVRELVLTKIAG